MSDNPEKEEKAGNRDEKGRFIEGVSGNPNGRPKGFSLVSIIRDELQKTVLHDTEEIERARQIIRNYIDKADDDGVIVRDLIDRIDGKPTQKNEVSGTDGEPIVFKIEIVDADKPKL